MNNTANLKVGDKVYLLPYGNFKYHEYAEGRITSIGTKYIHIYIFATPWLLLNLNKNRNIKVNKTSLRSDDLTQGFELFSSYDEMKNYENRLKYIKDLRNFNNFNVLDDNTIKIVHNLLINKSVTEQEKLLNQIYTLVETIRQNNNIKELFIRRASDLYGLVEQMYY